MILNKLNTRCEVRLIELIRNIPTKWSIFTTFLKKERKECKLEERILLTKQKSSPVYYTLLLLEQLNEEMQQHKALVSIVVNYIRQVDLEIFLYHTINMMFNV